MQPIWRCCVSITSKTVPSWVCLCIKSSANCAREETKKREWNTFCCCEWKKGERIEREGSPIGEIHKRWREMNWCFDSYHCNILSSPLCVLFTSCYVVVGWYFCIFVYLFLFCFCVPMLGLLCFSIVYTFPLAEKARQRSFRRRWRPHSRELRDWTQRDGRLSILFWTTRDCSHCGGFQLSLVPRAFSRPSTSSSPAHLPASPSLSLHSLSLSLLSSSVCLSVSVCVSVGVGDVPNFLPIFTLLLCRSPLICLFFLSLCACSTCVCTRSLGQGIISSHCVQKTCDVRRRRRGQPDVLTARGKTNAADDFFSTGYHRNRENGCSCAFSVLSLSLIYSC